MDASLRQLLSEHRATIEHRWRDLVIDSYSRDAARFMRKEKDRFANPMGSTIERAISGMWDGLVDGGKLEDITPAVEDMCRLRAVQEASPSESLSFVPLLKTVVRDVLPLAEMDAAQLRALLGFESRVDELMLIAFDAYSRCRERIFEIRTTEIRGRSDRVLQRLNERLLGGRASPGSEDSPTPVDDGKGGGST